MPRDVSCSSLLALMLMSGFCCACAQAPADTSAPPSVRAPRTEGSIVGVVSDPSEGRAVADAFVSLSGTALVEAREVQTDGRGIYRFEGLPPGNYTVDVLSGDAWVTKVAQLRRGALLHMNFTVEPAKDYRASFIVEPDRTGEIAELVPVMLDMGRSTICLHIWTYPENSSGGPLSECHCEPETFWTFVIGRSLFEGGPHVTKRLF